MGFWQLFFLKQERPHSSASRISAPQPGMESGAPALGALSLTHWTKSPNSVYHKTAEQVLSLYTLLLPMPLPGESNGNPLQYSCPENSMQRGAWWATVYRVANSQTQLSTHTCHYQSLCISTRANNLPITPFTLSPAFGCMQVPFP